MRKFGLCIGINDYPGTQNDLSECVHDMEAWARVLSSAGFDVRMLRDRFATRRNILDQIGALMAEAVREDSVIITYSGHGTQVPDEQGGDEKIDKMDEAICNYDLYENGPITDDQLWAAFKKKRAGVQLVMISDSCHSGTVVRGFERPSKGKKRFMHHRHFWKPEFARKRDEDCPEDKSLWPVLLLAGCQDNEYSYDAPALKNGAFTYFALKALKQVGAGATYQKWFEAIKRYLPSRDYPQTPNMVGSFGAKKALS